MTARAGAVALLFDAALTVPASAAGLHPVDQLVQAGQRADASRRAAAADDLATRVAEAVDILQSFREDDEARQAAFRALTGQELLLQFGGGK